MALVAESVQGIAKDVEKLFARIYQLEQRQVTGRREVEAQMRSAEQQHRHEVASLRGQAMALETKAEQQDSMLSVLAKAVPQQQQLLEQLETRSGDVCEQMARSCEQLACLEERMVAAEFTCSEMTSFSQGVSLRLEELVGREEPKTRVDHGQEREVHEKLHRLTHRLGNVSEVLSKHGITSEEKSLCKRLAVVEETCKRAADSMEKMNERARGMEADLKQGLEQVEVEASNLRDLEEQLRDARRRVEGTEQSCVSLQEKILSVEARELQLERSRSNDEEGPKSEESPGISRTTTTESMSRAVSKVRMAQQLDQIQELLQWRHVATAEMERLHRLGRIMEDRLEGFDVLERRSEELARQFEALAPRGEEVEASPRSRSSSPGAWHTVRPNEHSDLRLNGKGAFHMVEVPGQIVSPVFQGTSWAKSLPRRPYSAGARGESPTQLQQLREKLLQAVPALPPEIRKQLQAASPQGGVFPKRRQQRPMSAR